LTAPVSFRDPAGRLADVEGRLLRIITDPQAAVDLPAVLRLTAIRTAVEGKRFVASRVLPPDEWAELPLQASNPPARLVLEHERVAFPSYPYEWAPEMLVAAGRLTLDLACALLEEGHGLKDATPYNVLFEGPRPLFVDVASIERRDPADYTWLPQAQFERTFLLPLLAAKRFGLRLDGLLMARRDGLEPQELYRMASPIRRLVPPFLWLVSLPTWLTRASESSGTSLYRSRRGKDPERSKFILSSTLRRLSSALDRVAPTSRRSTWSTYMESGQSYSDAAFAQKEAFVRRALEEEPAERVLDVGCNTGHFSALATREGAASVVAIDSDPVVVGETWRRATADSLPILPLVVDLARPSPGVGWKNAECAPFLDRATGKFDLVLMLAVIHHLMVTERVPLESIVDVLAQLTSARAIVEYVGPGDTCFRRITRGRDALHAALSPPAFEAALARRFRIVRAEPLAACERRLYLVERHP